MQLSNIFVQIYIAGVIASFLFELFLKLKNIRNRKFVQKNFRSVLPPELADAYSQEEIDKTCSYCNTRQFFAITENTVATVISVALLASGFYVYLSAYCWQLAKNPYLFAILFSVAVSVVSEIFSVPFELYGEFVIEKKFGFSKMTFALWLKDSLVSAIVSLVITTPLLLVLVFLIEHSNFWWLIVGVVYVAFSLLISVIYPVLIAPLFNKFSPLEDGELKSRITSYLEKSGFKSQGVFVMDASKRSAHSNAYFTGFGKSKRVVLYDTLIEQLTVDELGAVLAHELGHYKHHHIAKQLATTIPLIFVALFVAAKFVALPDIYSGFGFSSLYIPAKSACYFLGFFLLGEVFGNFSVFAGIVANCFSRRHEYEADAYAKEICGTGKHLITSLIKLNKENKSDVMPAKIYSAVYYSHPTLAERIEKLK